MSLLDGGREGAFYEEIVNYFYYCQLRSNGEVQSDAHRFDGRIRLSEVVALLRALGYYPSQVQPNLTKRC